MRIVSWSIAAPTMPAEVITHAKGVSREKALSFPDDRMTILVSCAGECERWIGRGALAWGACGDRYRVRDRHNRGCLSTPWAT